MIFCEAFEGAAQGGATGARPTRLRYGGSPDPLARPGVRELAAFYAKTRSLFESAMPRRKSVVACNDFKGGIFASVLPCAGRLSPPPR